MMNRRRNLRFRNPLTPRGAGVVAMAFALCGYAASPPGSADRAFFVWNATASAPIGFYRVTRSPALSRGDLVLVVPPPWVAEFAAHRGYLPLHVPLVKRIAAMAGNTVCTRGRDIFIDGRFAAVRLAVDGQSRPLPAWSGCRVLDHSEILLLMEGVRTSFDGRYFGPTNISQIVGHLDSVWTR